WTCDLTKCKDIKILRWIGNYFLRVKYIKNTQKQQIMRNPLESLDELILNNVFEPITQYAHKKLGWDKYDLAKVTTNLGCAGMMGFSTYGGILGAKMDDGMNIAASAIIAGMGFFSAYYVPHMLDRQRVEEYGILEKGAKKPKHWATPLRPFYLLSMAWVGVRDHLILERPLEAIYRNTPPQYDYLNNLVMATGATMMGGYVATWYFKDTTLFPPAGKKKKLWKSLYEGIKNRIPGVRLPVPVEVPATEYQNIERLMESDS
ncbi:MAG: hypothetical protein Q7K45_03790, partial [Nanoarchaeota archaeon]|nr:hypothetical protein [Nanoarchaeota archaeon]